MEEIVINNIFKKVQNCTKCSSLLICELVNNEVGIHLNIKTSFNIYISSRKIGCGSENPCVTSEPSVG